MDFSFENHKEISSFESYQTTEIQLNDPTSVRKNEMPLMSSYHPKPVEIQVENKAEESYRPR